MQRFVGAAVLVAVCATGAVAQMAKDWAIHDETRPMAKVVDPGPASATLAAPPSDAVVLFDGKDLSKWRSDKDGSAAKWKVENGYMEVAAGTEASTPSRDFGDAQVHVEWMAPDPPVGKGGQDRGNSGVFLMGRYEVQSSTPTAPRTRPTRTGRRPRSMGIPALVNPGVPPASGRPTTSCSVPRVSTPRGRSSRRARDRPFQRRARPGQTAS